MLSNSSPALILAPMDGVTDSLMRGVLTAVQPFTMCVTEFIRVTAISPPLKVLRAEVPELLSGARTVSGVPVHVQLLGGSPDTLAETASRCVAAGAHGVDLNFGCPAPTVNRHDGGATLLRYPERIERIVSEVRSAVPNDLPVSVKMRLGWECMSDIHENAQRAARAGASWITIHGRTKMQSYNPPAYWEPIGLVQRSVDIPVVANGEIWTVDDFKRCHEITGCKHFMLGRGALAHPKLPAQCARYLGLPSAPSEGEAATLESWSTLFQRLLIESVNAGESSLRACTRMKQWGSYAKMGGNAPWFDLIKRMNDPHHIIEAVSRWSVPPHEIATGTIAGEGA